MSSKSLRMPTKNAKHGTLSPRESLFGTLNENQRFIEFEDGILSGVGTDQNAKDAKCQTVPGESREERCQRLLGGLGECSIPGTEKSFNYVEATLIARGANGNQMR